MPAYSVADSVDYAKEISADDSKVVKEIVCRVVDIPEGTRKMVEVRGRQILIVNDNGKFYAFNGMCPHYGYSMEYGVYSNGKIRCPVHGGCFNVKTGDIEDYPTFDSIHPFEVLQDKGDLIIKTTVNRLATDKRTRKSWIKQTSRKIPIIVVGGGISAQSFVENLRQSGCSSPIVILSQEAVPPYDRVLVSKFIFPDIGALRSPEWYKEYKVDLRCNSKVVKLEADAHIVTLENGTLMRYCKLVIATGAKVRTLRGADRDLKGVYTLRNVGDMRTVAAEAEAKDVVCIGGSFIGMEAAAGLSARSSKVSVICSTQEPLPAFGEDIGKAFHKKWESAGIDIHTRESVEYLEGDEEGRVKEVVLRSGKRIRAEVVVAGIGVEPDTDWLRSEGIDLDGRGFIKVNEKFETSGKDVFAIGDVVSAPLPFWGYESINIQHFQTAQRHGQLAALALAGKQHDGKLIPFFWMYALGVIARLAGCTQDYDDTLTRGELDEFDWTKYYFKNGIVVAVSTAGNRQTVAQFQFLCEQGVRITNEDVLRNLNNDDWSHLLK